jgi:DNA repair protein RecO (recombination protein O)
MGLIVRTVPLKDGARICSAFSPDLGLFSFVISRAMKRSALALGPYGCFELVISAPRSQEGGDLYRLRDFSITTPLLGLREDLSRMKAAAVIAEALLKSQLPGRPSFDLFRAALMHLKAIEKALAPMPLAAQFLIKLLKYEGLLEMPDQCTACGIALEKSPRISIEPAHTLCSSCSNQTGVTRESYTKLKLLFASRTLSLPDLDSDLVAYAQEIFTQKIT